MITTLARRAIQIVRGWPRGDEAGEGSREALSSWENWVDSGPACAPCSVPGREFLSRAKWPDGSACNCYHGGRVTSKEKGGGAVRNEKVGVGWLLGLGGVLTLLGPATG